MSHRRTDSASSAATDVSMQSSDEVEEMLTRSQSTISEASIPEPAPGAPLGASAAPLSRDGSMDSVTSVRSISEIIQPDQEITIKELLDNVNKHPTSALVKLAKGDISVLSRIDPSDRLLPAPSDTTREARIDCHRLLDAMLRCASSASSEPEDSRKAERYVAAAIVSCRGDLDQYIRLANTWFGLFLWPFRHNEKYTAEYSENATPTIEETASHAGLTEIHERTSKMKDAVIARDDYKCVVSGFFDYDKYRGRGLDVAFLQCAHILNRAVGVRAARTDHESVSLFDILIHLFPRAASRLRDLGDKLDTPANGIMLGSEIHLAFDHFVFCLVPWPKENPNPNTYKIVKLSRDKISGLEESIIKFEDHSHEHRAPLQPPPAHNYHFRSGQQEPTTSSGVDLPDPKFIEIHAAVANIMHMSGAAGFIDYVLRRWGDEFPKLKVPKADELEDLNYLASAFAAVDLTPGMGSLTIH